MFGSDPAPSLHGDDRAGLSSSRRDVWEVSDKKTNTNLQDREADTLPGLQLSALAQLRHLGRDVRDELVGREQFLQLLFLPAGKVLLSGREGEGDDVEDGGLDVGGVLGEKLAVHHVTELHQ